MTTLPTTLLAWLTWNGNVRLQPQPVTTSVNSLRLEAFRTTAIIYLQLQVICTETGHWWADSDHPLLEKHFKKSPTAFQNNFISDLLTFQNPPFYDYHRLQILFLHATFQRCNRKGSVISSPGNSWIPLPLVNACWYKKKKKKNKRGDTTCCVDVGEQTPRRRRESAGRSGTPLSLFPSGILFLCVGVEPPQRPPVPCERGWGTFKHQTLYFSTLFSDMTYTSEDKSQTPSHSSQHCLGFILFQNQCVGLFAQTASCVWLFLGLLQYLLLPMMFDLKSCPALKKSFGGYFVLWFAVAVRTKRSHTRRITVTAIMTIVILVLFECFKQSSI